MTKVTVQVPMQKDLKENAEKLVENQGFSSLQEFIRFIVTQVVNKRIEVGVQNTITLSSTAEKRYEKMTNDFKTGKNIKTAESIEDLMTQLHENPLS